jgi:hypothetical protein
MFGLRNKCCNSLCPKVQSYTPFGKMCTFFARCAVFAVILAGCSRNPEPRPVQVSSAASADTVHIKLPVIRVTVDSASGSAPLDSASLALLERRVMSRVASLLRAEASKAAGGSTAGIPPVKNAAPEIRHGLLGTIEFSEDGSIAETSRERIAAIAKLLEEIEAPIELRASAELGVTNIDVAIARARRVYLELIARNRALANRAVVIGIQGINTLTPIHPRVEIFWQDNED